MAGLVSQVVVGKCVVDDVLVNNRPIATRSPRKPAELLSKFLNTHQLTCKEVLCLNFVSTVVLRAYIGFIVTLTEILVLETDFNHIVS